MEQLVQYERRQHPRYRCEGKAEIRTYGATGVKWGTITDLSAGGCYIELASPDQIGQPVRLNLTVLDRTLSLDGKVAVVHPMFGMGIVFTTCAQPEFQKLQEILYQLSGLSDTVGPRPESQIMHPPAASSPTFKVTPQAACSILDQVIKHLAQKGVLTRADMLAILERKTVQ